MPQMNAAELGEFVRVVDEEFGGDLNASGVAERFYPLQFRAETAVDQSLDPFSQAYYDQQLALYREIAGRDLNQWDGELHPVDVDALIGAPNPLGIFIPSFIGEHVRAISTMLGVADLGPNPHVLDLGSGHGLSSEVLAFSGCRVHAIDIDPELGELSQRRAAVRSLPIERSLLSYDDLSTLSDNTYAAAFFFQSFHHCLRPWALIAELKRTLEPGGVIAFTGEPIQSSVWQNWGLRLDQESLYVARKYGWFESGWSHEFIRSCFTRNGFALHFVSGGHGGGEIAVASADPVRIAQCLGKAAALGLIERYPAMASAKTLVQEMNGEAVKDIWPLDIGILRSPAGFSVRREGDTLVCNGTGRSYLIVDGNAHLYDTEDVPQGLIEETSSFGDYVISSLVPDLNIPAERSYADAKVINTELMFSALRYLDPERRRVAELGAWRCESVKRFADLGFDTYALDFFPGMIDAAFHQHEGRPFHRLACPMAVLPFQDQTIDLLYMHATLHHAVPRHTDKFAWCDPHNMCDALREARRVLKPDGALFLLGEGVYPEGLPISERYLEKAAEAGETFYESWYTMSEYERVFAEAGIFPTLMSNQTALELELHGYENGRRVDLVKIGDGIRLPEYHRIAEVAAANAGDDWSERILPSWIKKRERHLDS